LHRVLLSGEDAELALKLLRHGVFEQFAALRYDAPELVADGLVHDYAAPCGWTAACSRSSCKRAVTRSSSARQTTRIVSTACLAHGYRISCASPEESSCERSAR